MRDAETGVEPRDGSFMRSSCEAKDFLGRVTSVMWLCARSAWLSDWHRRVVAAGCGGASVSDRARTEVVVFNAFGKRKKKSAM